MEDTDALLGKNENTAMGYFYGFYTRVCLALPQILKFYSQRNFQNFLNFVTSEYILSNICQCLMTHRGSQEEFEKCYSGG